ncbi:putative high-molecular-weight surface-exposed protein [Campylobacter hyointestinalis subsp. hyointestinalis]|uniref:High-molecular-weight surface-exposed protein n=1 Tax=Campylobacter hyointestinalis subsp. hyointestinalis TaxID=91352 RepID=A0A9W5AS59_CAMHY|nr:hypothetical protein [Campylobacter hyointestinalis]CUU82825.1 putative high-molecular-weight surface-exposed protein [Campylobacter hyointestinalis subsp. hyointestinalis]
MNSNNSNDNNTNSNNLASFSALNISDTRSNSGSHVDTKGVSILVGISKSIDEEFIYGMFVELGKGNYDSYNSFNTSSVHGSVEIANTMDLVLCQSWTSKIAITLKIALE